MNVNKKKETKKNRLQIIKTKSIKNCERFTGERNLNELT